MALGFSNLGLIELYLVSFSSISVCYGELGYKVNHYSVQLIQWFAYDADDRRREPHPQSDSTWLSDRYPILNFLSGSCHSFQWLRGAYIRMEIRCAQRLRLHALASAGRMNQHVGDIVLSFCMMVHLCLNAGDIWLPSSLRLSLRRGGSGTGWCVSEAVRRWAQVRVLAVSTVHHRS